MMYKIDIIPGYKCNFRCKYCFEQLSNIAYNNTYMSDDIINNTVKYIKEVYKKIGDNNKLCIVCYGGEPLLHTDIISKFINELYDTDILFNIVTNGYLINTCRNVLCNWKKILGCKLNIIVSYDYSLQNIHRMDDSYNLVRNNILYLYKNKYKVSTITVFPIGDLPKFYDVFEDFLKLRKKIHNLKLCFNIDRINASNTSFNEEKTREALEKIKNWKINNPNVDYIEYNNGCGYRNYREEDCIFGNVYSGIDVNGNIYPTYNAAFAKENIREMIYLGNVKDSIYDLDNRRNYLLNTLNFDIGETCKSCGVPCRVFPWRTITSNIDEFNKMPSEEHCYIHKLLAEYLS